MLDQPPPQPTSRTQATRSGEGVVDRGHAGECGAELLLVPRAIGVGLGLPSVIAEVVPADAASVPVDLEEPRKYGSDRPEHPA